MAVHGVSRSTRDVDLFTLATDCLAAAFWTPLTATGLEASVRTGDADDPLAGIVRVRGKGDHPVDVVVGKSAWQESVLIEAREELIEGVPLPVAGPVELILLKLYAGGPQDAWDIDQILNSPARGWLTEQVETRLAALPEDSRSLWRRIKELREGRR